MNKQYGELSVQTTTVRIHAINHHYKTDALSGANPPLGQMPGRWFRNFPGVLTHSVIFPLQQKHVVRDRPANSGSAPACSVHGATKITSIYCSTAKSKPTIDNVAVIQNANRLTSVNKLAAITFSLLHNRRRTYRLSLTFRSWRVSGCSPPIRKTRDFIVRQTNCDFAAWL